MTFDAESTVSIILRLAHVSASMSRSRELMSANTGDSAIGATCLSAIREDIRLAYELVPVLIDAVSRDTLGPRRGGLNELLVRAIRQIAVYDQGALLLISRRYESVTWCASAPEMLRLLACEILWATAAIKYGDGPRESARHAFLRLQRLGEGPLGEWLLEGARMDEVPEIQGSCRRLWIVLNIGNQGQVGKLGKQWVAVPAFELYEL